MTRLALGSIWLAVLATACAKPKHVAECDTFQATVDKLANCPSLPATAKDAVTTAAKQLKGMFEMLDQAGGNAKAPPSLQDSLKETCRAQNAAIVEVYQKVAPACLK